MITEDLIDYIRTKRKENITDDEITSRLLRAGWHDADITEGFQRITPPAIIPKASPAAALVPPIVPRTPKAIVLEPQIEEDDIPEITATEPTSYKIPKPEVVKSTVQTSFSPQNSKDVKPLFTTEAPRVELTPTLIPKVAHPIPTQNSISPKKPLPESPLIKTFSSDIQKAEATITEESVPSARRKIARSIIIVLVIGLIGGAAFAFLKGYISFASFIKKDPKVLLLGTPSHLSSLSSYRSDTTITASFPSVANITNGLISGNVVTSKDTDSVSIDIKSTIHNNSSSASHALSDHAFHIRSSLIQNDIDVDLKYNGTTSFITIPDLSNLFGEHAPLSGLVAVGDTEFDELLSLVPIQYRDMIRNTDFYKMKSNGIPPYVINSLKVSLKELIDSADVSEKPKEVIQGIDTYHYILSVDRADTKKFLISLADIFITTLSETQKKNLEEALGASNFDTIEVWVGTDDSLVHQYKFSLSVPLSKVINLEDKGIDGNTVTFTWQSSVYDFNQATSVLPSETATPVSDFVKLGLDKNIKTTMASFITASKTFRNALGSYGKTNTGGSCVNPSAGSLFSPVGHTKGAATSVGAIAHTMNILVANPTGEGSCLSTPTAWAMAFPLASDPTSSYCVDSTGSSRIRTSPLTTTLCDK